MSRVFLIIMLVITAAPAWGKPIPDLSLTPEESFKQPDTPSVQTRQPDAPLPSNPASDTGHRAPAGRFMDGYCDPNFKPVTASSQGTLQSCLQDTRLEACRMFQNLPPNVQNVIDQAIRCTDAAMGEEDAVLPPYCKNVDSRRLQLTNQYRNDPEIVQGLTTMPEMVNNPVSYCTQGKR